MWWTQHQYVLWFAIDCLPILSLFHDLKPFTEPYILLPDPLCFLSKKQVPKGVPTAGSQTKRPSRNILPTPEQLRETLDQIGSQLSVLKRQDWYKVGLAQLVDAGLSNSNGMYQHEIFQYAYPDHEWIPWLFPKVPKQFWQDPANQFKCMEWLFKELNFKSMEDWYKITLQDFKRNGAAFLVNVHQGSFINLLQSVYPKHDWKPWKFDIVPRGFWSSSQHRRNFVDDFARTIGVSNLDQWYSLTSDRFKQTKLASMLTVTKLSLPHAIMDVYPEHEWEPWRFNRLPGSWWESKEHRRQYFDFLVTTLELESPIKLLRLPVEKVHQNYGGSLLYAMYRNSMTRVVVDLYPEIDWAQHGVATADLVAPVARHLRNKFPERRKQKLEAVGERLGVKDDLSAWYSITKDVFIAQGGGSILKYYRNSLQLALQQLYPDHGWQASRFVRASRIT
jgi:hypothetical protein